MRFKEPQGQIARWLEELSQYNMIVQYRKGRLHVNADALSRIPTGEICNQYSFGVELKDLPCGGCKYCTRVHTQWSSFLDETDDIVRLATGSLEVRTVSVNPELDTPHQIWDPGGDQATLEVYPSRGQVHLLDPREELTVSGVTLTDEDTCWGLPLSDIQEEQGRDPDLKFILAWLQTDTSPRKLNYLYQIQLPSFIGSTKTSSKCIGVYFTSIGNMEMVSI